MRKIKVTNVLLSDNDIEISYDVTREIEHFFFVGDAYKMHFYEPIKKLPKSIAVIPFLTFVLPVAWATDSIVEVEELDEDFYNYVSNLKHSLQKMHTKCDFSGGKLKVEKIIKNKQKNQSNSSMFYSGGVDSLSSLISVRKYSPNLITIWGSDI